MAENAKQKFSVFDVNAVRAEFPILTRRVKNDRLLTYFDNAASKQKPLMVLDAMEECYTHYYANVHRGAHTLSAEATDAFEATRRKLQHFIGAKHEHEVIFTKGTTESINLVANSFGQLLEEKDKIIISISEHHSNIVPWQLLRDRVGVELIALPLLDDGQVDLDALEAELKKGGVKLVALNHASNALGVVNDAAKMVKLAHAHDAKVLLDGCQAAAHLKIDVQALDVDFYAFSAHKMYGPSGVGVLYGKEALLDAMPPYQGGGEMIDRVTIEKTTWAKLPFKFEAGTPAIAEVIGFGAAVDFLNSVDRAAAHAHEQAIAAELQAGLEALGEVTMYGRNAPDTLPVISFNLDGVHHSDVASIIDQEGVAVRNGHHCAQPLMDHLGVSGTARASLALYNTREEVAAFLQAMEIVKRMFA